MSTAATADPALPVLQVAGLTRTYPAAVPVVALREATFEVHAGDFVTIVGPSGSGKSTLLQLLGLLDRPSGGSYVLNGRDTAGLGERERCRHRAASIGFVFQSFQLLDTRSAFENVALGLMYRGTRRRETQERTAAALDRVGLADKSGQPARNLSGGERQRVAIARALCKDAPIVLLDEATASLDTENEAAVHAALAELSADRTVLVIAHRLDTITRADQIAVLDEGRVVEVGAHHDLLARDGRYAAFWRERENAQGWRLAAKTSATKTSATKISATKTS